MERSVSLQDAIAVLGDSPVIFAGAGISAGSVPLVSKLISRLADAIMHASDTIISLHQLDTFPLSGPELTSVMMALPFEAVVGQLEQCLGYNSVHLYPDAYNRPDRESSRLFQFYKLFDVANPGSYHSWIARLWFHHRISQVITTNFDRNLEKACHEEGIPIDIRIAERPLEAPPRPTLEKVHGCASSPDTMAITVRSVFERRIGGAPGGLPTALSGRSLLVLGYSNHDRFDVSPMLRSSRPSSVVWCCHDVSVKPAVFRRSPHPRTLGPEIEVIGATEEVVKGIARAWNVPYESAVKVDVPSLSVIDDLALPISRRPIGLIAFLLPLPQVGDRIIAWLKRTGPRLAEMSSLPDRAALALCQLEKERLANVDLILERSRPAVGIHSARSVVTRTGTEKVISDLDRIYCGHDDIAPHLPSRSTWQILRAEFLLRHGALREVEVELGRRPGESYLALAERRYMRLDWDEEETCRELFTIALLAAAQGDPVDAVDVMRQSLAWSRSCAFIVENALAAECIVRIGLSQLESGHPSEEVAYAMGAENTDDDVAWERFSSNRRTEIETAERLRAMDAPNADEVGKLVRVSASRYLAEAAELSEMLNGYLLDRRFELERLAQRIG